MSLVTHIYNAQAILSDLYKTAANPVLFWVFDKLVGEGRRARHAAYTSFFFLLFWAVVFLRFF